MQTFQYIKGNKVKNATGYKLLTKKNDTYYEVTQQDVFQQMSIVGTLGNKGIPGETSMVCDNVTKELGFAVTPVTKLTEDGYVYYLRVKGEMTITLSDMNGSLPSIDTVYSVPFEGIINPTNPLAVEFSYDNQMTTNTNGIYLSTNLGLVKVYDAVVGVESVTVDWVQVHYANPQYRRTSFIPIECLTDDLNDACVGVFGHYEYEVPAYKIAFYSGVGYSTFLKGITYSDIVTKFGEGKESLTVAEVKALAEGLNAQYVIFCSHIEKTMEDSGADYVSVGNIFFPLWKSYDALTGDGPHSLVVQAIGNNLFFANSEYSDAVTYNKVTS